jgi:thioredoxin reductase (NADPH)
MSDNSNNYDVIIIGSGPAGLSAGIYTARAGRSTLIIEKGAVGGRIINSSLVENYPGFESISGIELTQAMYLQAKKFGIQEMYTEVISIENRGDTKVVKTTQGDYLARVVIIAGGLESQKLEVPGEEEYTGKGVSYCATCDGALFRNKVVAINGGGNTAVTEALELTRFASKVILIHRRNELRATKILQEKAFTEPKLEFVWDSVIIEISGDNVVKKIKVRNLKTNKESFIQVSGIFVSIGVKPNTNYLKDILNIDENGSIITNEKMETNVFGILAAGDIRSGSIRQLVAAAGDGAVAAITAEKILNG